MTYDYLTARQFEQSKRTALANFYKIRRAFERETLGDFDERLGPTTEQRVEMVNYYNDKEALKNDNVKGNLIKPYQQEIQYYGTCLESALAKRSQPKAELDYLRAKLWWSERSLANLYNAIIGGLF